MTKSWGIYVLFAALVLLLLLALRLAQVEGDNDLLRLEAAGLRQENSALTHEAEANRAAALAREDEVARLARENAALTAAINEVYANDPNAKAWADTLCPDSVLCLFR